MTHIYTVYSVPLNHSHEKIARNGTCKEVGRLAMKDLSENPPLQAELKYQKHRSLLAL